MQISVDAPIFLMRYLEPHKILTNPRWTHTQKVAQVKGMHLGQVTP
jgi:hypothetical protein